MWWDCRGRKSLGSPIHGILASEEAVHASKDSCILGYANVAAPKSRQLEGRAGQVVANGCNGARFDN